MCLVHINQLISSVVGLRSSDAVLPLGLPPDHPSFQAGYLPVRCAVLRGVLVHLLLVGQSIAQVEHIFGVMRTFPSVAASCRFRLRSITCL